MSDVSWDLSLRAEQPIEGCELFPHAYVKIKSFTLDNPAKAKILEANPHIFSFQWSRGPNMQMCQSIYCPRKETYDPIDWCRFARGGPPLRCSVCEKIGVPRFETLFCSARCFKEAWSGHSASKHLKLNRTTSSNINNSNNSNSGNSNNSEESDSDKEILEPDDPDDAGGGYVEGHIPTSLMDENHGGQGHWEVIHGEKSYVPTSADVGRILRIECKALTPDGTVLAGPVVVYTESVLSAPRLPPRRALQAVPQGPSNLSSQSQFRFRIVSYNILAEIYATKHAYPYTDPWSLTWPYRRSIILQELGETQGDIICLQEVQADHYTQSLLPLLGEMGYDGLYKQKTRESMGQYGKVDGCAIFWKRSKFIMVENYPLEFNEIVLRNAHQLGLDEGDKHRYISRLSKDNVAQIVVLEALVRPPQNQPQQRPHSRSASRICMVNTHLYSNHTRPAIKLWQTITLLKEIEQFVLSQDLAMMICGDFNSEPDSAVYQYLSRGALDDEHTHLLEEVAKNLADVERLALGIELESAMYRAFGMEPQFTNYTRKFKGTLDYIWYTPSRLKMLAVSTPPSEDDISTHCEGLPSVQYPSDHILLCCDVALNILGNSGNGGGGGGGGGGVNSGAGISLSTMALRQQLGIGNQTQPQPIHSNRSPSPTISNNQMGNKSIGLASGNGATTARLTQQQTGRK